MNDMERTIVFATNNPHKLREIGEKLPDGIRVRGLKDIGCVEDIPETRDSLAGNASQKAEFVRDRYGYDAFADDTGLEIGALNGRPGVYSARYSGEGATFESNMRKVLTEMEGVEERSARFRTVIALLLNEERYFFEGSVEGEILTEKRGEQGFGYDPIFLPKGCDRSFAEMSLAEKNRFSHRAQATEKLIEGLKGMSEGGSGV